jgi:hypothetical protein
MDKAELRTELDTELLTQDGTQDCPKDEFIRVNRVIIHACEN